MSLLATVLALPACRRSEQAPVVPVAAVKCLAKAMHEDDLVRYSRLSLPPELHARMEARWKAKLAAAPPPRPQEIADYDKWMGRLTAPDAERELIASIGPRLDELEKNQGGSAVAKHSRLLRAAVLFDMGRYDEAATAYREVTGLGGALGIIAREGVGLSLEAKALADKDANARTTGLDAALAEFKALQPDEKGFYRDVALFHQGRILALNGDKPGAIALFKELTQKFASSPMAREARARLELLEG